MCKICHIWFRFPLRADRAHLTSYSEDTLAGCRRGQGGRIPALPLATDRVPEALFAAPLLSLKRTAWGWGWGLLAEGKVMGVL